MRRKLSKELFETRSHAWESAGLAEELEATATSTRRARAGLALALVLIAGALVVYGRRGEIAPGYETWVRIATVAALVIAGTAAATWLGRWASPAIYRRLDPAAAGTVGFLIRLISLTVVVILALRIAGVTMGTLAVGGAFTAIVLGLAAQQTIGNIFAGIVLQSTRPFRVGQRVRFVGGALAGSIEGTVSSLGLFYTTLAQGADRLRVPNAVLLTLVIVPLREPDRVDVRVRFEDGVSPGRIAEWLRDSVSVPTRYPPHVALEEIDSDGVVLRVNATPLRPKDGAQLADEVLGALRRPPSSSRSQASPAARQVSSR
jgi:small-conductance mechanosensitive channel